MTSGCLPHYDWTQSYEWNYGHSPDPIALEAPDVAGKWDFCGLPVSSPLGIAAGPLLNGRWILYYASLGFDVLTYKTVRSRARACYPMPNLQPISASAVSLSGSPVPAQREMRGSWAVSFGMPSKAPDLWRADVAATRKALPRNKVLSVSVVATPEPDWTLEHVAHDFSRCAQWAVESGADSVEANFSCPNVASADAQLYQQPAAAALVAKSLRSAIGAAPLLIKIGHVIERELATQLIRAVAPYASGLVMVNCVSATVIDESQQLLFDGQRRGIAGAAIRNAALNQIRLFAEVVRQESVPVRLVGVGGISNASHVVEFLEAGCHSVQLATAAMMEPAVGLEIRRALSPVPPGTSA